MSAADSMRAERLRGWPSAREMGDISRREFAPQVAPHHQRIFAPRAIEGGRIVAIATGDADERFAFVKRDRRAIRLAHFEKELQRAQTPRVFDESPQQF